MIYRIAVTSSDGEQIDQHFGQANQFDIIEVNEQKNAWEKIETRSSVIGKDVVVVCGASCNGHKHDSIEEVINLLADCKYILTGKIGKHSYSALQRAGITALESPFSIHLAVEKLNQYHKKITRKGR